MEELSKRIKYSIEKNGCKMTVQRQKVIDVIIENQHKHLNSEEIYAIIKKDYPEMGIATIYRTMQLLEKMNIVVKFDIDEDGIRYELRDIEDKHQHPHFICTNCGAVIPLKNTDVMISQNELNIKYGFKITDYSLKLYGICKKCSGL
ncbi:Fur family transcriptional regulator [Clostridium hydrogenum]|uniref:Fur family transcriptional regulator n=1 Tax=Clostridium hydrogenum TaxID=2855764 RepID=UPI001F2EDF6D|nr:Fur family transcriptional regulator [Clostridium hydrogenum]